MPVRFAFGGGGGGGGGREEPGVEAVAVSGIALCV